MYQNVFEVVGRAVDKVEQTEDGLRCILLGQTNFDFECDVVDVVGITRIDRKHKGYFVVYNIYLDAQTFFDSCDCGSSGTYIAYITENNSNQKFKAESNTSMELVVKSDVELNCRVERLVLSGDCLFETFRSKSMIECSSVVVIYRQINDILCYNLTVLYLMGLGLLSSSDGKGLFVDNKLHIYITCFSASDMYKLCQQLEYHFELLEEIKGLCNMCLDKMVLKVILNIEVFNPDIEKLFNSVKEKMLNYYDMIDLDIA